MATVVHDLELPTMDLLAAEDLETRQALVVKLREECWLARSALGYAVLRYEDVVAILRERRFHQAASRIAELSGVTDSEFLSRRGASSLLTAEGDEHARLRRLVAPAFTPKAADRLRPFMREVVNQLVDGFAARGHTELMADVCEPYPIPIICELLGAPQAGLEALRPVGVRHPPHLQLQPRGGPADHHEGPGRAGRLRRATSSTDRRTAPATTCSPPSSRPRRPAIACRPTSWR